MSFLEEYKQKLVSADEAVKIVKSGDWVDYGWCTGTPDALDKALARRTDELKDVNVRGGILLKPLAIFEREDAGEHFTWNSWHMGGYERKLIKRGLSLIHILLSILKLDSILLTLLSTVIHVSFPLSLSQKGICSSIVYHKTLHLYYKFPYYEKRTHNLLRCHCHSNLPPLHCRCLPLRLTIVLTTLYHCDTIFCDTLQGLQANH